MVKTPVPWMFHDSPIMKTWIWKTPHFEAKIFAMGSNSAPAWKVVDVSGGTESTLENGEALTFLEAEKEVLELVGKSYPPTLGYWVYARELATTFITKNGEPIDFGPYEGKEVLLEIFNKKNPRRNVILSGALHILNFDITLQPPNKTSIVIPPAFIISVREEDNTAYASSTKKLVSKRRILPEEWRYGCTGSPGFAPNTVIHNPEDAYCPIHGF